MAYRYNPLTGKMDMVGIVEGSTDFDADKMSYTTPAGTQTTVGDELDEMFAKIFPIKIAAMKLNGTNGDINVETGKSYAAGELVISWELSSSPTKQTLSSGTNFDSKVTTRSASNSAAVSTNKSYILKVEDASGNTAQITRYVNFCHRRYAKCLDSNAFPTSGLSTWVSSFKSGASTTLLSAKSDTVTYTPASGKEQYLWYAIPQALTTSPAWKLNAGSEVSGGMTKKGSATIVNEYNKSITYDFYCSNQAQAGKTILKLA